MVSVFGCVQEISGWMHEKCTRIISEEWDHEIGGLGEERCGLSQQIPLVLLELLYFLFII